jgi:oligopeptide/dipeptide ABC transporter ATP-binding protein
MNAASAPLLEVVDLVKEFPVRTGLLGTPVAAVHAVSGVSFTIERGQALGLVGESGCGKTTTGRLVMRLLEPTAGAIRVHGEDVAGLRSRALRELRRRVQIVFQDPSASLNPRMTVHAIVGEPLRVHGRYRNGGRARVGELLELVGLDPDHAHRFPAELSGGQRQRVGIARALALEPELLVLDEPVSALDVSIQAGIVNLLQDLRAELGVAYLFIAHDLALVRHVCDAIAVMYLGKIVEQGPVAEVYARPAHPYTQALLSAVPVPDPRRQRHRERILLEGDVPSPVAPPSGCRFRTRCWLAQDVCAAEEPALVARDVGHPVACHFAQPRAVV